MNILLSTELFWPYIGGVERMAQKLIADLSRRGYDFTVLTSHDEADLPDEDSLDGVPIYRFAFRGTLGTADPRMLLRIRKQIASRVHDDKPDLVHIYSVGSNLFYLLPPILKSDVPVVVTLHNEFLAQFNPGADSVLIETLRRSTWVACCSDSVLQSALKCVPELESRSSVIRNGLDLGGFKPGPMPTEPFRLLCLGRLVPQKRIELAILAMRQVVERYSEARLIIAGDGPERSRLEALADANGLGHAVEFLGSVSPSGVPALLDQSTLLLMPSSHEGLPLAAIEAQLVGRPVVATSVGGIPEIVRDEMTGFLVSGEESSAFSDAVLRALDDPGRLVKMGAEARRRALESFGQKKHNDEYQCLYDRLSRR
jgi:glycogen(starch) synthase